MDHFNGMITDVCVATGAPSIPKSIAHICKADTAAGIREAVQQWQTYRVWNHQFRQLLHIVVFFCSTTLHPFRLLAWGKEAYRWLRARPGHLQLSVEHIWVAQLERPLGARHNKVLRKYAPGTGFRQSPLRA